MLSLPFEEHSFPFLPRRMHASPDGSCFIATSFDKELVVFNEDCTISLRQRFPACVTNCSWYPLMQISNPASCCFACVLPSNPVLLIDSVSGRQRSCYRCQYNGDHPASLTSVCFNGNCLLAGGTRTLYECNITRSGSFGEAVIQCPGSIMSIAPHPTAACIALGISTGDIVLIDSRTYQVLFNTKFHTHAIDQIEWYNGIVLTSARLENEIIALDTKMPNIPCMALETKRKSSRPISINIRGDWLLSGNEEGEAKIFDLKNDGSQIGSIGKGPTSLAETSTNSKKISTSSGGFELVEDTEEEEVSYQPKLTSFRLYTV